ncbi:class I SAM-dependent methyltransferase [Epibacterium sp. SM1969]|uniref:Class I SAM-dependent methyltransferase n=1 Tax=Tritonibacter aquimaris TaxID=2663379 RepID=A0A844ANS3_9RHOB|nr:class I SAM-dependent methyltransferase [Tritonibacter aquimaris]MQY44169.1 class I SAM-dependent methyltransferase [Tritonibacter aquimaris]
MIKAILDERASLLFQARKGGIGAEIGVHEGGFSKRILQYAQPEKLYLIDPWQYQPDLEGSLYGGSGLNQEILDARYAQVQKRFAKQCTSGRVNLLRMDSLAALAHVEDNSLDFVYIDGDHRYPAVRADLNGWFNKVKPGGHIMVDDYRSTGWWGTDVIRACNEFLIERPVELDTKIGSQIAFKKHNHTTP